MVLEADGFTTACAHLADIQNGTLDLLAFVHLHKPELIIYDLPRPYESHWNFLRLLKETDSHEKPSGQPAALAGAQHGWLLDLGPIGGRHRVGRSQDLEISERRPCGRMT